LALLSFTLLESTLISTVVISEIQYRNWIYISCTRKLHSLLNADKLTGASMNAATTTATHTTSPGLNSKRSVRDKFRTLFAEMRRAFVLSVEAYGHGIAPPM
jgi:hypothetical protein